MYTAGKLTFVLCALPLYLPCAAMIILPIGECADAGMHGCDAGVLMRDLVSLRVADSTPSARHQARCFMHVGTRHAACLLMMYCPPPFLVPSQLVTRVSTCLPCSWPPRTA